MRIAIIMFLLIFLFACNKDDPKIQILTANINGDSISFVGNAQKYSDLKNGVLFGYNYHIYNLETPNIYIEAYDSSLQANEFSFQNLSAKYAHFDSDGNSKSYDAIDGSLNIINENDGVIYGNFYFTFLNVRDKFDTLNVKDGYFEISLEEYNREWNE